MRIWTLSALALSAVLALLLCGCGGGGSGFADDGSASGMLTRINAVRASSGNPSLAVNAELATIAQTHADYMAGITELKPTTVDGTNLLIVVQDAGFGGNGRILANGLSESSVFASLQNDDANSAIFDGAAYTLAGIGYATSSTSQWWCILVSTAEAP